MIWLARSSAFRYELPLAILLVAANAFGTASTTAAEQQAGQRVFRAGAYAIDISPIEFPVIVNGGMSERTADGLVDPLHARCLVLDDGTMQLAVAVVDNCVIPRELMDRAKDEAARECGIPSDRILICATHAHSTPSVIGVLGSGRDERYAAYLPGRIAEGIAAAYGKLAPARIGWGVGSDPKNVFCRRFVMKPGTAPTNPHGGTQDDRAQMNPGYQNPNAQRRTGPADTDVSVLSIQTPKGVPIALLGNYSTHYAGAPSISADYFGVFCRRIGELVGAEEDSAFVALMTNGTSGDANCCDFVNPRRDFTYVTVGEDVARAAFQAYGRIEYFDWVPLVMEESLLELGVRKPTADEVARAKAALADLGDRKPATIPEVYARETLLIDAMPDRRQLKLQAVRIGPLGITAMPNEVFGSTGLAIKAASPLEPTFNIELANGYSGYIPPPDQFELGGYTTWRARSSCLEVQAEVKIKNRVIELLEKAARSRADERPVPSKAD